MIGIINYGLGNIASIKNMLWRMSFASAYVSTPEQMMGCTKLILPGVGSFDTGMKNLTDLGIDQTLNELIYLKNIPILGICLGMQLLTKASEEGDFPGLGLIDAYTVKFSFPKESLRIPHMGWNTISPIKNVLGINSSERQSRFYFAHSYYVHCNSSEDIWLTCKYGIEFVAAFIHGNIYGVQFHPEKSHVFGMQLLRNFVELDNA